MMDGLQAAEWPPCASLVIEGRLLSQHSLPMPESNDDEIVMSWPWRLNLRVDDVLLGKYGDRRIEAIGLQHTALRRDYGRTFFLGRWEGQWRLLAVTDKHIDTPEEQAAAASESGSRICEPV